jgi:hypothetical protein
MRGGGVVLFARHPPGLFLLNWKRVTEQENLSIASAENILSRCDLCPGVASQACDPADGHVFDERCYIRVVIPILQ